MTSIYDIPYEDIKKFLLINNKDFSYKDEAYRITLSFLKDKKAKGHTISIIEWMIAYNLLVKGMNIPSFTVYQIDNMNQLEIDKLAKLLTIKTGNRENIKNILKYLHKLKNNTSLPRINFRTILDDIIILLKTHPNKSLIRREIYDNMENIIFSSVLHINLENFNKLKYIKKIATWRPHQPIRYSKSLILELIQNNKEKLLKNHTVEEINNFIDNLNNNEETIITKENIDDLIYFLKNLTVIDEMSLVDRVFDIANKYKFGVIIKNYFMSFNEYYFDI